ncbi:MAG TPA: excinuclease ABC subunit UvrB [Candidatus Paceibacterota bacterium]
MSTFKLQSKYKPAGDQPKAIEELTKLLKSGNRHQTLLGVTGSGKTFTMANVIANLGRPALVISHNKTLAAQLYQEFKTFFPKNSVHYFVSYYDYYQPEAYIPQTDTYIEKDARINEFIDTMRHATTASVLSRNDFVVVASVSCIYGIGDPEEYRKASFLIKDDENISQRNFLRKLAELRYERNDYEERPGLFKVKGETIKLIVPSGDASLRIEWNGNKIETIYNETEEQSLKTFIIFPAKHFVTPQEKLKLALSNIETELKEKISKFKKEGKLFEAERIKKKTEFDLKMIRETGYTHGIENYSRHLSFRNEGEPPSTLLDFVPKDTVIFIDESHMSVPQIRGMYAGDRARKQTLVEHGFRLPSAIDNRPLKFPEFDKKVGQVVYVSATPAEYELDLSNKNIIEQIIRPTGLLDPLIEVRTTNNQMKNVLLEIEKRIAKNERVIVTTLTKRMAEDLADYLKEKKIKAEYLHSDIKTLERPKILNDLRKGNYDVIVGINLLREGLDLPEVSLVIILDADKEGFLRNAQTLIQTIGRTARHTQGTVLMYADTTTKSMKFAINETERRRKIQKEFNKKHGITPQPLNKEISENIFSGYEENEKETKELRNFAQKLTKKEMEKEMHKAAKELNFEKAAELRDLIKKL